MNLSAMEVVFQIQDLVTMFLHRVPYIDHENLRGVCSEWRNIVSDHPRFLQRRRESDWDEPLLLVFKASEIEEENCHDEQEGFQSVVRLVDPGTGRWRVVAPLPEPRVDHCSAFIAGTLYTIGGCDAEYKPIRTVHRYDVVADTWTECAPLNEARSGACCGALGGGIVVAGGWSGSSYLSSIEFYDPSTNTWEIREPMSCGRGWAQACVLSKTEGGGSTDHLCMYGGIAEEDSATNEFGEVYDFNNDSWTVLPRAGASITGGRSTHPMAHPSAGLMLMGVNGGSEEESRIEMPTVTAYVLDKTSTAASSCPSNSGRSMEDEVPRKKVPEKAVPRWRALDQGFHGPGGIFETQIEVSKCLALDGHRSAILSDGSNSDFLFDLRSNVMKPAPWSMPLVGSDFSCAVVRI